MIIDGKKMQQEILVTVKEGISKLSFIPVFCDVFVGDNPVSAQYVRMKNKTAESLGIKSHQAAFPKTITTDELVKEIMKINAVPHMCGVIVQLPLPVSIDRGRVLDAIDYNLDVDCLGKKASNEFYDGHSKMGFPTALACMAMLDSLKLDLESKNIICLGQGELVGKPVTALLRFRGLEPITIDRDTEHKEELIKKADVIISGIGRGRYITGDMIKKGAALIDAGTSESSGAIVGDVDFESVKDVASYVSPVPGGVGPVTVAMLFSNVLKVAKSFK